ncbi:MAG TPA: cobalamin-dependent protein [bacterium]|nr:cobalamin-dependent protein [bacterium]
MILPRKIERVLLIHAPVRLPAETMKVASPPLGAAYLAAAIRDEAEVRIMDAAGESNHQHELDKGFTWYGVPLTEIGRRVTEFKPDLVGITCLFSSVWPVVKEVAREIRRIDSSIVTAAGGTHPSFLAQECLQEPALDLICIGEGEQALREIVRRSRDGRPLNDLDGIAYKEDGRVAVNPRTRWIEDLDTLPFPARDLLPMEVYRKEGVPHSLSISGRAFAPMITSRGCPAHCIYCSSTRFWGSRCRFRSPENVLDEIGELIGKWGIEEIQFEDDNLTADRARAKAIFRGISERGYKIKFNFPNGVALWTLDEELVEIMIEAGCYEMTLAFESGCQEVLSKIVKKPLNLEKAERITRHIHSTGLRTDAFYILGFPGETREQVKETIAFAHRMKTDMAYFFIANPLPGAQMYEIVRERGLLPPGFNFEDLSYSHATFQRGDFAPGELERLAHRAFLHHTFLSFLRRPRVFLRRFFLDLLLKRPRYTLGILVRIWRRNFGGRRSVG